jgi:periplasmic divalent cation tolerance protein
MILSLIQTIYSTEEQQSMHTIKVIYITNPSKEEAEKIACHLLEKKLIACANISPIDSIYWWQGALERSDEFVLVAKTVEEHYEAIKKEVEQVHSYAVPCIVGISSKVNEKYYNFIQQSVI